jgi:hypothetical protein
VRPGTLYLQGQIPVNEEMSTVAIDSNRLFFIVWLTSVEMNNTIVNNVAHVESETSDLD